ncbi:hypothetical protein ACFV0D_08605 [Streptomyces sp. NPDC059556]
MSSVHGDGGVSTSALYVAQRYTTDDARQASSWQIATPLAP